jgi:hypothetical protein
VRAHRCRRLCWWSPTSPSGLLERKFLAAALCRPMTRCASLEEFLWEGPWSPEAPPTVGKLYAPTPRIDVSPEETDPEKVGAVVPRRPCITASPRTPRSFPLGHSMPFRLIPEPTVALSTVVWRGPLSFEELKAAIDELAGVPDTRLVLWDFSEVTELTMTVDEIRSLARLARQHSSQRPADAKTAVLVTKDFLFGIARQAHAYAIVMSPTPPIEIFRDRRAALSWLGVPDADRD